MKASVLIDTNIILDAAMCERDGWSAATLLLDEISYGKLEACVASTSLKDVYYILSKYGGEPFAREYTKAALDAFDLASVDEEICRIAVGSNEPDFEDGIIRACAEHKEVDFIISRDTEAFKASAIKRLSPQDYIDLFCEVEEISLHDGESSAD